MSKVSVIIPVYNGAKYIGEAIESVFAQTWPDWELIVVDDGSTDETPAVVARYAAKLRYERQANAGPAAARNRGLRLANGDYVVFLDADDLLLSNSLTIHAAFLDRTPDIGVVYSDGYYCNERGDPILRLSQHRPGFYAGDVLEQLVLGNFIVFPHSAMVRRRCLEQGQICFDEGFRSAGAEDWDFWLSLAQHATFGYVDVLTCKYRVHSANMSRKGSEGHVQCRLKILEAPYFSTLSLNTRYAFFYQLLVSHLKDRPADQAAVLASSQFQDLPDPQKACFFRLIADEHILACQHAESVKEYLARAIELEPMGLKQRVIYFLWRLNPTVARIAIRWRRRLRKDTALLGPAPSPLSPGFEKWYALAGRAGGGKVL